MLRHEGLTYELRGLIYDVHNTLKVGWPEEVYHRALSDLLMSKGIPHEFKPHRSIVHRGVEVDAFECDLIVRDTVIIELKALSGTSFARAHFAQLIHYLKCWHKDLGLLVNFGSLRVQVERIAWDEPPLSIADNSQSLCNHLSKVECADLEQVKELVVEVARISGLGYPEALYRKMAAVELRYNGLTCVEDVEIPVHWHECLLARHVSDHLFVQGHYLLNIRSLLDRPTSYDLARMKTYLNSLGLRAGLIANFGKRELQIVGIEPE